VKTNEMYILVTRVWWVGLGW